MTNKNQSNELQIWDKPYRAKGHQERNPAFECFLKYRDMGAKRSLIKLAEQENIKYKKLCDWSSNYHWNERIRAMLEYENEQKKQENARIKKKALEMINQRLEAKNELIGAIFKILQDNVSRYNGLELDFKEFASLLNLAMKIESTNIEDMSNIYEVEQILKDGGLDAQRIQAFINQYSMVISKTNNDAISQYEVDIQDDKY